MATPRRQAGSLPHGNPGRCPPTPYHTTQGTPMSELTHFDEHGGSRMVDTSDKEITLRQARASALVRMAAATATLIQNRAVAKGDVLEVARLAGIMAAKH